MNINYKGNAEKTNWGDVARIFQSVGWGERDPQEIESAFSKSSSVMFAYHDERLVGFGRTLDDGVYYAMIVDLVVDPEYQGKKIGAYILKKLRESMQDYQFLTLTAATGKEEFYEKQKWLKQTSAYIWPVDEKQKKAHTKED